MTEVLFVIDSLAQRGGTELQLLEVVARVDARRFRIHVCTFDESALVAGISAPHRALVFPLTKVNSAAAVRQTIRLRHYICENRIQVLEAFMFKASVAGVLAAAGTGCRSITSRRNLSDSLAPQHIRAMRLLNRWTDRILANAEAVKAKVVELERVPAEKVDVLYNGVDIGRFSTNAGCRERVRQRLGIAANAKVAGIVANLRPVKDIPLFLEAARDVAAKVPEAAFLIVGQGALQSELERLAGELGIRERVYFAHAASGVAEYLAAMDVGCLTSRAEGFSNAILEYMAAGLPAVATAVGGGAEAIVHGETGYLVKSRSAGEIAGHISSLLSDDALRAHMGRAGYERCRNHFDMPQAIRQREEYWTGLLGN